MSDRETELDAPSNPETGRAEEHQLPPDFIFVLCAALAGGLPAGIFTTLISEPGRSGSRFMASSCLGGSCRFSWCWWQGGRGATHRIYDGWRGLLLLPRFCACWLTAMRSSFFRVSMMPESGF